MKDRGKFEEGLEESCSELASRLFESCRGVSGPDLENPREMWLVCKPACVSYRYEWMAFGYECPRFDHPHVGQKLMGCASRTFFKRLGKIGWGHIC